MPFLTVKRPKHSKRSANWIVPAFNDFSPAEDFYGSLCAVHDGLCFVTDLGGRLYCIDAATGRPLWQTEEAQPLERMIAGTAGQFDSDLNVGFFPGNMGRGMRIWNNGAYFGGGWGGWGG